MKSAQLEEEKSRTLENLKTIVQLRESLKQEQEKNAGLVKSVADLQGKLNKLASVEENQLVKKNTQLEDERKKSGEQLKAIELLKESLKTEKDKNALQAISSAELHAKLNKLSEAEENQLLKKNTLLEEEKKKSLQYAKEIDLFKERLKQEQAKTADLEKKTATQEIKVKELTELLGKISTIAAGVKAG
jgi:N-acetylmuramoyl-L-alanine amidase CwlA